MSDPVSALKGASYTGFASVRELGPLGMITLRAKGVAGLAEAVQAVTGTALPAPRQIVTNGDFACGWMSPDEYLLILPYGQVAEGIAKLNAALAGQNVLVVDVSDARAVFRIEGEQAHQVLAKLSPVDFATFAPGELRRTRAAQVACAFWKDGTGFTLVSFRSVARYVFDLLATGAQPGSELA